MKRIICPFPARSSSLAPCAALLTLAAAIATMSPNAAASARPQIGGTLRVEISEHVDSIDPRQRPSAPAQAAAVERIAGLVFDRLVRLDEQGMLQPALA